MCDNRIQCKPIVVRGGGDIATGTIHRLAKCGYPVLILETENPSAIRRYVSFCEAVYQETSEVEGILCQRADSLSDALIQLEHTSPVILVDPKGESIDAIQPEILIDGILAKKNLGTRKDMADLTIALGPGFTAGEDVDYVIETMRGHSLGAIIEKGQALPNTGVPGTIAGVAKERVIHAACAGVIEGIAKISHIVSKDETIAYIHTPDGEKIPVKASISGVLRGLIRDHYPVTKGFKIADIDPRDNQVANCFTISDKARCIAGSVLELVVSYYKSHETRY